MKVYAIFNHGGLLHERTNLRLAKDEAKRLSADYIIEYDVLVTLHVQKITILNYYLYASRIGRFITYKPDEFERCRRFLSL